MTRITKAELQRQLNVKTAEADSHENISNARQKALFEIERKLRLMLKTVDGHERKVDLEESQVALLDYFHAKYLDAVGKLEEWSSWAKVLERNWENRSVVQGGPDGSRHRIEGELHHLRNETRCLKAHTRFGFAVRNVSHNEIEFVIRNADLAGIVTGQVAGLIRAHPTWGMAVSIRDGDTCIKVKLTYATADSSAIRDDAEYALLGELHDLIFDPLIHEQTTKGT
jgi:hypothetical protein